MENQSLWHDPRAGNPDNGRSLARTAQFVDVPSPDVTEETGPGLLPEYWDILRRNASILGVCGLLGLVAGLLFTLLQPPLYRARTSLEIQNLNENFLNLREVNPTTNDVSGALPETDLQTQVQILQSESVLDRVITQLNLEQTFAAEWERSCLAGWTRILHVPQPGPDLSREEILRRVSTSLTIQTDPKTRLVEVFYESRDPQLAAKFVNALTAEFIQQNLDARWRMTQQTGEWLTRQIEDVRRKLEKSEHELRAYAKTSRLLFTSEEDNIAEEKLHQLQEELSRAQADRVQAQSKYESASKASLESLPEVLDDKTLGEIQVKLTDLRRQLAELSSALTPEHPSVIKVQAQITALEGAMESKRKDFLERIQNEFRAAERRENLLETNYTAQVELVTEQADKVAHYNNLKRDVDTQRELYESMLHSVQEAGVSSALRASNIRVVDPAFPPTRRYKPTYAISLGLGLLAGLLFGMGFAVMRQRADRSFQAPGEAGLSLGVPELGVIPSTGAERNRLFAYYGDSGNGTKAIQPGNGETGHRNVLTILGLANRERALQAPDRGVPVRVELIASRRGSSVLADSFRATLTSILFSGENGNRPRVIVVTSASPGEGKTTVASNLALALADAGSPVLLVDGDLRKGRLHDIFQVSNDWGFSDVLAGNDPPPGHTGTYLQTHYPRLSLLPAGATPPSITGLLHSPRTLDFLSRVRKEFHTVIVDTPPMLNMADARVLGKLADGVILVLRSGQTTRESAAAAAQRLTADRTRVLGAVLNEWDPQKSSRASYAYRYA